jgi:hypothetical protein
MNGTDLPTLNVYAHCGEPRQGVGVYSYRRDLEVIRGLIDDVSKERTEITNTIGKKALLYTPQPLWR